MENSIGSELLKSTVLPSQLQDILPCDYSYKLKKWTPFENNSNHFEAVIFINVYTEEEAHEWWHQFNLKSNTTMRVKATCPKTGKVNTFKIYLRCLHQGRAEKSEKLQQQQKSNSPIPPMKRNTNCPAGMIVAIRRHIKYSRSKLRDPIDPVHPCEVKIRFIHNHPINEPDLLRFRPVSKETEEKLLNLFQAGHSPTSALEVLKIDLQVEHGPQYAQVATDRCRCPDKAFCYRLYIKHFDKDYFNSAKEDIIDVLNAKVQYYNNSLGESCIVAGLQNSNYVIAVCTPLMKRAHSLPQCCDAVFAETYESNCSKELGKHYVLLLIALTAVGGVPLGAILTSRDTTYFWKLGFQLLQQLLPTNAFSGRGMAGPCAFLIGNSEGQRAAFLEVWPESGVITCIFRLLQHFWKWLWDEKHKVLKDHRLYLLYLAKILLFAASDIEMNEKYQALKADNIAIHYPMYLHVIETLWNERHTWSFSTHQQLSPFPGAVNYYEAAARALKDKLFEHTKAFNFVQLLNYLVTRIDSYYKIKILDILNNRSTHVFRTYFSNSIPNHVDNEINQVAGNYFLVPNEQADGNIFTVDAELNVCSCPFGINGALCLHQHWVFLKQSAEMFKVGSYDTELGETLSTIINGNNCPSSSAYYHTMHEIPSTSQTLSNNSDIQMDINSDVQMDINSEDMADPSLVHRNAPQTEAISESLFVHNNLPEAEINMSEVPSNHLTSLSSSHEVTSIPDDSANKNSSAVFANDLTKPIERVNRATITDTCIDENINRTSQIVQVANANVDQVSLNTSESSKEEKGSDCDIENTERRMTDVLEKFEVFYERVREGLRTQPNDFLPALEIMMKNLERKGNSNDLLVTSLSFFGVLSAPSLENKERKRSSKPAKVSAEEIVPKVYGRPMITYGKGRQLIASNKIKYLVVRQKKDPNSFQKKNSSGIL